MADHPSGVMFLRDQAAKDAAFKEEMRALQSQMELEGSLTPAWQAFFDKVFAPEGIPDTIFADFFALLQAQDGENTLTEEEVAALLACPDGGQEP